MIDPSEVAEARARSPEPVKERSIVRDPGSGAIAIDPNSGTPLWPPQPDLPELEGSEQEYRDVPAEAEYWSDAARAKAEGWKPLAILDECIRQREALRMACRRVVAARNGDTGRINAAVRHAADLLAEDPAAEIVDAITAVALDAWMGNNLGPRDSVISGLSWELETRWRQLCHTHQRAILQSLIGRDSPACNRLRAFVESMDRQLQPPTLSANDYVVTP